MTPVFAARRRAEEFAALVEDPSTRDSRDARHTDLLELVGALRSTPAVQARPEFVAGLRERLMDAADTALAPSETARLTLPPRRSSRDRRIAAAVGGFALVGATTSMAMAAQGALPGDVLYPVKRAIENVQTGVSVGEGQKGEVLLANASGRLDEVGALSRGGDLKDTGAIADTLNTFTDQAAQASDLLLSDYAQNGHQGSVSELRDFTASSLGELQSLEPLVPAEARDELLHAAQVLFQIDAAAQQACPDCGGKGITEVPPVFAPVSAGTKAATAGSISQAPGKHRDDSIAGETSEPQVPTVDGETLPPGSVLDPTDDDGSTTSPPPGDGGVDDPIDTLTEGLTGGGDSQPTSNPTLPDVGDTVDGTVDDLGKIVDGVTDPLAP